MRGGNGLLQDTLCECSPTQRPGVTETSAPSDQRRVLSQHCTYFDEGWEQWKAATQARKVPSDRAKYPARMHPHTCRTHLRCLPVPGRVQRSRCLPPHSPHKPLSSTARGNRASQLRDNGAARRAHFEFGRRGSGLREVTPQNEQRCGMRAAERVGEKETPAAIETRNSDKPQQLEIFL